MTEPTNATPASAEAQNRTGFCQECGRSLSVTTLRRVNGGTFCIPCAIQQASPGRYGGPPFPQPPAPAGQSTPNPARAAVLGFIPGVGAMYNGQYAKGALHLVIFVLLLSLADNISGNLYWLVWGWVFYQAFDAYHTARARRDGLPLPNPFGWNDVGERWSSYRSSSPASPIAAPWVAAAPPPSQVTPVSESGPPPVAAATDYSPIPDWTRYPAQAHAESYEPAPFRAAQRPSENPYADTQYAAPEAPKEPLPFPSSQAAQPASAPGMQIPYRPTYTGAVPPFSPMPVSGIQRFPVGALWLMGLGLLFLLGNLQPSWHLSGRWLVPSLLAFVGVWSAIRRWDQLYNARGVPPSLPVFAGALVGPVLFLSVASLLALDGLHLIAMRRSWPVLLVIWGFLLAVQRLSPASLPVLDPSSSSFSETATQSAPGTGTFGR